MSGTGAGRWRLAKSNGRVSITWRTTPPLSLVRRAVAYLPNSTLFPCNVERDNHQPSENDEEAASEPSSHENHYQDIRYDPKRSEQIAESILDLSQRLTENIISQSSKKFEIVSPISIASALQLALLGANGMTFSEMMDLWVDFWILWAFWWHSA